MGLPKLMEARKVPVGAKSCANLASSAGVWAAAEVMINEVKKEMRVANWPLENRRVSLVDVSRGL
jgi:hypothetical protein